MTFRSILCPVDFSAQSRAALRCAVSVGRRFGGRVVVLFVNDPILLAAASAVDRGRRRRFVDRTEAELARFVKQATGGAIHRKDIGLLVSVGDPAEEILRCVKRSHSDLVVMGSHGLSRLQRAFFGSTTEQVLRNAHVPVLAIPPSAGSRSKAGFDQVTRVIAPIDLAGEWHSDAVRAAQMALALEAHLVLVHVLVPVSRHRGCDEGTRTGSDASKKPPPRWSASRYACFRSIRRYPRTSSLEIRRTKSRG